MKPEIQISNSSEWPKPVKMRFIEPGPVNYKELGTVLVPMECLDKMASSLVGKPIIDENHKPANPQNFKDVASGVVCRVWKGEDGWYWCEAIIWDEDCLEHCRGGEWSISCAYKPTQIDQKSGVHNGIPYSATFEDGQYTHIAVVRDPKYSDAMIVCNSRGEKMIKFFSGKEQEGRDDVRYVVVDGTRIPLKEVVNSYVKDQEEIANAVADDSTIEIDGKQVPVKNMIESYRKRKEVKNEEKKGLSKPHAKEEIRDNVDKDRDEAEEERKANSKDSAVSARPKETYNDEKGKPQKEAEDRHDKSQEELEDGDVHNSRDEFRNIMDRRSPNADLGFKTQSERMEYGLSKYGRVGK
ncbi:MAG: DUF2213 domain-containing protein [Patescibacteria group bacterium]|nr:DUF2213 domain-containing protein [Patescibacteria group bacterium]